MNTLHVFFTDLFQPLPLWQQDFGFKPHMPGVSRLLAGAQRTQLPVVGWERTLLHVLGLDVGRQVPWATLRYYADTGTLPTKPLLCADPVAFETGLGCLTLRTMPLLTPTETTHLLARLNQHVQQDGWQLFATTPQHWYLQALGDSLPEAFPHTTPPSEVQGNILPHLPTHSYWRRWLNEAQMLLHADPLAHHKVQGLWLWGDGDIDPLTTRVDEVCGVYGGGLTGLALAKWRHAEWQAHLPDTLPIHGNNILLLDQLRPPALAENPTAWQNALAGLEARTIPLLQQAVQQGRQVHVYDCAGLQLNCQKRGWWKLWA